MKNNNNKSSNCTNYVTESCKEICPGCEYNVFESNDLLLLTDSGYKPSIQKLLRANNTDMVQFVVEIHSYGKWFRIIRLKNYKRTHDFIINTFHTREILIENDKSQYAILKCATIQNLKDIFQGLKMYVKYNRRGDFYSPVESTETNIVSLIDFWQRDLNSKPGTRNNPIQGDIFTDSTGKRFQILKGEIPTQLNEYFMWLKKPEKGAYKTAPVEWFKSQTINTMGLYPLDLIKSEKMIAKLLPL